MMEIGIKFRVDSRILLFCLLLCLVFVQKIKAKICDIEEEFGSESITAMSKVKNEDCKKLLIKEERVPKKIHCLDLCNRYYECKSVNFNDESLDCLLFNTTITGLLERKCLLSFDNDDPQRTGEVKVSKKFSHTDVKKIDVTKVLIILIYNYLCNIELVDNMVWKKSLKFVPYNTKK